MLTGSFAGRYERFGNVGSYIHNFLSAWRQFGLGVFILYGSLTFSSTVVSLSYLLRTDTDLEIWRIALVFNAFATILVVTST